MFIACKLFIYTKPNGFYAYQMKQKHLPGKSPISIPRYKLNVRSHVLHLFFSSLKSRRIQLVAFAEQRDTSEVLRIDRINDPKTIRPTIERQSYIRTI